MSWIDWLSLPAEAIVFAALPPSLPVDSSIDSMRGCRGVVYPFLVDELMHWLIVLSSLVGSFTFF